MAIETMVFPTAVKALGEAGRIGGYLVVWGDSAHKDLQGEYFTPATDLGLDWYPRRPALYQHGFDESVKGEMVGAINTLTPDDTGVWAEAQLDLRKRWGRAVYDLVKRGALNWSSGTLPQLAVVERDGHIKKWPIFEGSLTPTPAEPRKTNISAKHLSDAGVVRKAYKSAGLDMPDLLTPESASEGDTATGQAGEVEPGASLNDSNEATHSKKKEDLTMSEPIKTAPTPAAGLTEEQAKALFAQMRAEEEEQRQQADLEAKAARADELEQELADLKAKSAPDRQPHKRLPGATTDPTPDQDHDPAAKFIISVGSKFDHMNAEDMAWGLSYMRAAEKARGEMMVSDLYVRATAEKTWDAGYRFLDKDGHALKADELMHTTNTGYGAEWIPDVWNDGVWRKARAENVVFNLFNSVEMPTETVNIRIEGTDPTVYYVPETTDESQLTLANSSNPIPDSKIGSGKVQLNAKKLALRFGISMEETEDAMIPVIPLYREQSMRAMMNALDNVILNGDTTTAATGNINSDDAAPSATDKYLVFDGLRHLPLVDNTAVAQDASGAPTRALLNTARFLMPMRHALRTTDLAWVVDGSTYSKLLTLTEVSTVDKYGPQATVLTGEIGRIDNIPILPSAEYSLTQADGKVNSAGSNTKGQATCVYRPGWLIGWMRRVNATLAYIPYFDSYQMVATMRIALVRFDTTVASMLYDITV